MLKNTKTVKSLKEDITALEGELWERIAEADYEKLPESFRKEVDILKSLRPKSRSLKIEYQRYQRELEYALQWDIDTPEGRRQMDEKERNAYQTFQKRFKKHFEEDISYDDWRDLVENFGSAGQAVMEQFYRGGQGGNFDIVRIAREAEQEAEKKAIEKAQEESLRTGKEVLPVIKKPNVGKAMQQVLRASKRDDFPYQKTPTGLLDALRDKIGLRS